MAFSSAHQLMNSARFDPMMIGTLRPAFWNAWTTPKPALMPTVASISGKLGSTLATALCDLAMSASVSTSPRTWIPGFSLNTFMIAS